MYDYLIVGAGLYGAVCARELTDAGYRCLVIDRRGHIAGNIYTKRELGIDVHEYGAHIFHTSDENVWSYVNKFAQFNDFINSPIADYNGERYNLPFNMNTFKQMWGVTEPEDARRIIAEQIAELNIGEPRNLEEQALKMVGPDVYTKLVKGYTEKQWGRDCSELPAFIIKRLPLRFEYNNNYFNDKYQGIPTDGYTAMVERMLDGIEVRLNLDYLELRDRYRRKCARIAGHVKRISRTHRDADDAPENVIGEIDDPGCGLAMRVIYTGTIDEYYGYKLGHLQYRTVRFEKEYPETSDYQGNAVVNYTDRETPYTRIIEHKHFTFGTQERTVISKEYPSEWKPGDEPFYPVSDDKNSALYEEYEALAEKEVSVVFGGRLGRYKYYDMDKVIAAALETVKRELHAE